MSLQNKIDKAINGDLINESLLVNLNLINEEMETASLINETIQHISASRDLFTKISNCLFNVLANYGKKDEAGQAAVLKAANTFKKLSNADFRSYLKDTANKATLIKFLHACNNWMENFSAKLSTIQNATTDESDSLDSSAIKDLYALCNILKRITEKWDEIAPKFNETVAEALEKNNCVGPSPAESLVISDPRDQKIFYAVAKRILKGKNKLKNPLREKQVNINNIIHAMEQNRCLRTRDYDLGATYLEQIIGSAIRDVVPVNLINHARGLFKLPKLSKRKLYKQYKGKQKEMAARETAKKASLAES